MWFIYFLASIGATTLSLFVFFSLRPLVDWLLRMVGFGIFILKISPLRKAKSWKHLVKFVFLGVPKECLKESGRYGAIWASEVSAKGITWKPYFTYLDERKKKEV